MKTTSFSWQFERSYLNKDNLNIDKAINYFKMSIRIKESEDNLLNIGSAYVYLAYSYSQEFNDKAAIHTLNNLIDKMSSFDSYKINNYYNLIDKSAYEFDPKSRFKGVLSLIKRGFANSEILKKDDFKKLVKRIENTIKHL